jgi:iron complex outermembrane receptor protein
MLGSVRIGLILSVLILCSAAAAARAQAISAFNLPAQPLAESLKAIGSQTNTNVLVAPELVDGRQAPALKATLNVDEALSRILAGTGINHKFLNEKTIVLASADPPKTVSSIAGAGDSADTTAGDQAKEAQNKSFWDRFRLAQVDQGQSSGPSTVEKQDDQAAKKKPVLEEVIVTGSRIPLLAGQRSVQPVRSYTRDVIESSGQSTMGEFLNTLPDVSIFSQSSLQLGFAGVQTVQLHGLPVGTTLTLLDGRRLETSQLGLFDLSNIPVSAVERVEMLPVGASAVYGADALAGAVNFILRKDFSGLEVNATLDHAADVNDPAFNIAWGRIWERGSVSLIASYEARGELLGTQREPTSLTQFPINVPASTVLALASDTCAPGNVYSVDGSNLPGLSSPQAGIPTGISGRPTIGQFAATAGKLNVCNSARYLDITPRSQREGALLSAHYQFSESTDFFTEILLSHRHLQAQTAPQITAYSFLDGTVSANNPYNPFGQDVNVSFVYPGAGQQELQSTDLIRPMIGVRGSLFSDWHYEATATVSRDRLHDASLYTDTSLIAAALASSDPATALNPFASGAPGPPLLLSSLTNPAVDSTDSFREDQLVSGQAILSGPIFQLPAGAVRAVLGSEYSREKQDTTFLGIPLYRLQRKAYAAFSEARIPVLAAGDQSPRSERLTLTVAGRYDHSSDYGGKATWQGGLLWRATETLSLTGSYGQSYRAPRLDEISGPQTIIVGSLGVSDPFRGGELASYPSTLEFGPNFNLKPETGDSSTLGLQYSSEAANGLHASLTWYDLNISNYIGSPQPQVIVDNPSLFPGAVVRAPPTPQDQQQGFLGVITQFNSLYYNFGDLRVKGFDADVTYAIDTRIGQFTPSLAIANIYRWTSSLTPSAASIDGVSKATFSGFTNVGWAPRWKGTAALSWKRGPLSANVAGRYVGRYLDYQELVPNTHEAGDTWIFDTSVRFEMGRALAARNPWLAHAYVALAAVNVFNKTPPFAFTSAWYDYSEYDIRGRFLHLSVGVRL